MQESVEQLVYNENKKAYALVLALLLLLIFAVFLVKYISKDMVGDFQFLAGIAGIPISLAAWNSFRIITQCRMAKIIHDLYIGKIIEWKGDPYEVLSMRLRSISIYSPYLMKTCTIPYNVLNETDIRHRVGALNGGEQYYKVSTHIDMDWKGTEKDLNDFILKKEDDKGIPYASQNEWIGLLHKPKEKVRYAGIPLNSKGEILKRDDAAFDHYVMFTTWHVHPPNRSEFHSTFSVDFFFILSSFWETFDFISKFNTYATQYFSKHKMGGGAVK